MLACIWVITFSFPFPANCTREVLLGLLHSHAKEWMGWERFPWRITRDLHHFIDDPPINFHYLLIQHCVTAYACHVVLSAKFMNLDDVLDMLIRNRFEFVGVLRHELIRSLQSLRDAEGKAHIPDCSNAEEGDRGAGAEEILRRRRAVMNAFTKATEETVRILNYASQQPNMQSHIAGHSLEAWTRGDSMPSPAELVVAIEQVNGETVISPQPREVSQFARVNRPVPKLVVSGLRAQSQARLVQEPTTNVGIQKSEVSNLKPVVSEQPTANSVHVPKDRVEHTVEKTAVAARAVRFSFTLDGETVGAGCTKADISNVELGERLEKRLDVVGREFAQVKRENESLKADAARVFAAAAVKVKPEYFRWILAVLGAGSVSGASKLLGKPNATFDAQLKKQARQGGAYRKLYEFVAVRRKLGVKSFAQFNEEFAKHQPEAMGDENVLKDVLEGLELLNGDNWVSVRKELMGLIEETGV